MIRRLALLVVLVALPAVAALRPQQGGTVVLVAPAKPVTTTPATAWNVAELALAQSTGTSVLDLADSVVESSDGREITLRLKPWANPKTLAKTLSEQLRDVPVSLPWLAFVPGDGSLSVSNTVSLPGGIARYVDLPWMRLPGGAFRMKGGAIEANADAPEGRPFADAMRIEVRPGRKVEVPSDGVALARAGDGGRPAFALVRGDRSEALFAGFATIDRAVLARFFVRQPATVLEWPLPKAGEAAAVPGTGILAVDASEPDLVSVAERLQVALRDRKVSLRLAIEPRDAFFTRVRAGDYDVALVALPVAPPTVQAGTLLKLANRAQEERSLWTTRTQRIAEELLLRDTAALVRAVPLFVEGGGVESGRRVRGVSGGLLSLDLGDAWLAPEPRP